MGRPMKILFVWTGVTSYMADCWRALAGLPDVELKIVVEPVDSGKEFDADAVFRGLDSALVTPGPRADAFFGRLDFRPDVLFAVGWHSEVVRSAVRAFPSVPGICCFDMPWRNSLRCIAARFVLWRYLRGFGAAYVPGAAAAKYAKWLGFGRVEKGLFSIDRRRFAAEPPAAGAPRTGFFYLGRFSDEKRIDLIEGAYRRYRELGGTWPLDMYGNGSGGFCRGFLAPEEVPAMMKSHRCLLLASAFDPWPLVVLEARSAGCEAIVSDRCGNAAEVGAMVCPFGDTEAMAGMMLEVERGRRCATGGISAYDCREWAVRTLGIARSMI